MAHKYFETASHAAIYGKFRPKTPDALAQRIVEYVGEKIPGPLKIAVDVGCGTGQSTEVLAPYFTEVLGFDANETAINEAKKLVKAPNVKYGTGPAEKLNFKDNSVNLVTAGQACHWFDLPAFFEEVKRILVPGGTLALYGYQLPRPLFPGPTSKDLSPVIDKLYSGEIIASHWPPERRFVDEEYNSIKIPLEDTTRFVAQESIGHIKELQPSQIKITSAIKKAHSVSEPAVVKNSYPKHSFPSCPAYIALEDSQRRDDSVYVEQKGTLSDLVGYVSSWSAFQNYQKQNGKEKAASVLMDFEKELMAATGSKMKPEETDIIVKINYFLLLGRKSL